MKVENFIRGNVLKCFAIFLQCVGLIRGELRILGSEEIGFLPEDAAKVCRELNGSLAEMNDENRSFFAEFVYKRCDMKNGFCPKMCILERNSGKFEGFGTKSFELITQPIFLGDTLHLKMQMELNTSEVIQISNPIEDGSQEVALQLTIFNAYTNQFKKNQKRNRIGVGYGSIKKKSDVVGKNLHSPKLIKIENSTDEVFDLTLEFTKDLQIVVSCPQLLNNKTFQFQIGPISGRMYFKKYYEQANLLDAYFTRGSCLKSDFHHFPKNEKDRYVNCYWTRPTMSIPVYNCRKASYVACAGVPRAINNSFTTTTSPLTSENPTTSTISVPNLSSEEPQVVPLEPSYFHADVIANYLPVLITLSGITVMMLITSIVLQSMKVWQNRLLERLGKNKVKK